MIKNYYPIILLEACFGSLKQFIMRKLFLGLILLLYVCGCQGQIDKKTSFENGKFPAEEDTEFDNGSQISTVSLNQEKIENLKTLGLIWGFLKYYHPVVAKGEYNWDFELFRILPKIIQLESREKRDKILFDWISSLGKLSESTESLPQSTDVKLTPDLDWISNSGFSPELADLLNEVENSAREKYHYYITLFKDVGQPEFKNENKYSSMKYPDAGFRILSLFRYWNMIQYYFPYKNLIEEDWKLVLEEFIPRFLSVRDETEYNLIVLELIGRIHDTHAKISGENSILHRHYGLNYAPVEVKFIENVPVVTGYFDQKKGEESGLKLGDQITSINSKPVEKIVNERFNQISASN